MKFTRLGNSGLSVSRLCLGCMTYGDKSKGWHGDWLLGEDESRPFFRQALEAGINFFDTANGYAGGTSEEITGKLLREMARRDEIVVATKAFIPWRNAANTGGLSRNRSVGLMLAGGQTLAQAVDALGHVAEGVHTAATVLTRARSLGVEMPLTAAVVEVLEGRLTPVQAMHRLMSRDARAEAP